MTVNLDALSSLNIEASRRKMECIKTNKTHNIVNTTEGRNEGGNLQDKWDKHEKIMVYSSVRNFITCKWIQGSNERTEILSSWIKK